VWLRGIAVDKRRLTEQVNWPIRMLLAHPANDVSLNDGKSLGGPVLQILVHLLAVQPLKQQPGGVAQVEERLAVLIHEVAAIRADLQLHVLDRTGRLLSTFPGLRRSGQK